jgi:enamine deaminase RidA (YjgF/YER057c/UK114 family)
MGEIIRLGSSRRWSDVVVHGGVASWVEVAEDPSLDARGQVGQVLSQIDATLAQIGSDRTRLLQVLVYLAPEVEQAALDGPWDAWVPAGHAPIRATVRVGLAAGCLVEMVVTAASSLVDPGGRDRLT